MAKRYPNLSEAKTEVLLPDEKQLVRQLEVKGKNAAYSLDYPENMRLMGKVVLPVNVAVNKDIVKTVMVQAKIKVIAPVVETAQKISKYQELTRDKIMYVERDLSVLPKGVILDEEDIEGCETVITLQPDTVLLKQMIRKMPVVRKGQAVYAVSMADGITVSSKAIALSDGFTGKNIRIKIDGTKKVLEGVLVSTIEVQVK